MRRLGEGKISKKAKARQQQKRARNKQKAVKSHVHERVCG